MKQPKGTINFTPALTDFQNSTEQVTSTEVLGTTDGINGAEVQFNLNDLSCFCTYKSRSYRC